jgi:endonuclease-3
MPAADAAKALRVNARLKEVFGPRERYSARDPLDELILTILSQNTSDRNSGRAYRSLRAAFSTWEAVLAADTRDLYEAIKSAGLGNTKAPRIQAVLQRLVRSGLPARSADGRGASVAALAARHRAEDRRLRAMLRL